MLVLHVPWGFSFNLRCQFLAVRRPGIVAHPAERFEAASEASRNARRKPAVNVGEAFGPGVARGGLLQGDDARPALARRGIAWIEDRKSTRLNSSHANLVCRLLLEKKKK